jgi:O-antigen/teichoic acid export membrane protein
MAQRHMLLKGVTIIDLVCQVGALIVTLTFAWFSRSIWAIVIGGVASALLHIWLTHRWLPGPPSKLKIDRDIAREIIKFGRWIVISSSLGIFAANADRMLLGSWVTPEVLGFYAVALSLFTVLMGAGDRMLSGIVFPMLSEAARDSQERFHRLYRKLHLPTDLIFLFASGGLFASAEWIVKLLFDPRYEEAGHMLKILSLSLVLAKYNLAMNAYLAQGRTSWLSAINAVQLVGAWTIIPLGFHFFGLQGALIGIALRSLPMLPLTLFFNSQLRINNWKVEIGSLVAWPVGYAVGHLVTILGAGVR